MRPIGCEGVGGIAQRGRSLVSMIALFNMQYAQGSTIKSCAKRTKHNKTYDNELTCYSM